MNKQNILLSMREGDTITAEFTSRYKVAGVVSKVEVAGVKVGQITKVRELDGGGAAVEMKLDKGTLDALGSNPRKRPSARPPSSAAPGCRPTSS